VPAEAPTLLSTCAGVPAEAPTLVGAQAGANIKPFFNLLKLFLIFNLKYFLS